jgi:hypothetical protein
VKAKYLGTKLFRGTAEAAPGKLRWWPRHARQAAECLEWAGQTAGRAACGLLQAGAVEWDEVLLRKAGIPHPPGPGSMSEHATLEASLAEAAFRNDVLEIARIGGLLAENVRAQSDLYRTIEGFPKSRWTALFGEHVDLWIAEIELALSPNRRKAGMIRDAKRRNTLALAALTAEWL